MKRVSIALLALTACVMASCGKKKAGLFAYTGEPEQTWYEVTCIDTPADDPARRPDPYKSRSVYDPFEKGLPESLPEAGFPVEVTQCSGLGAPPRFAGGFMPGVTAVVDCNANIVQFRTRDWQLYEFARIGPLGEVDTRIMYISRLTEDAKGNESCWTRLLGHITGTVNCPSNNPMGAQLDLRVEWRFDETPPEIMEPPTPGKADLRNGPHCEFNTGNCDFANTVKLNCFGPVD